MRLTKENTLPRLLIVGNFLSHNGGNRSVCEDLSLRLRVAGHQVITTSRYRNRPMRLADMLSTTWRKRKHYDVAQVVVTPKSWTQNRLGLF